MPSITSRRRRLAAFRINPLDGSHRSQHAFSRVAHHLHQQPRNRLRVRRSHVCRSFSHHSAPVACFPRRPREVFSKRFPILVKQLRLRSLQRPPSLRPVDLARINLIPLGVNSHHQLLVGSRLQRRRHLLRPCHSPQQNYSQCSPRQISQIIYHHNSSRLFASTSSQIKKTRRLPHPRFLGFTRRGGWVLPSPQKLSA